MTNKSDLLSDEELFEWCIESSAAIADAARGRADAAIAGCPGWTMAELIGHVAPMWEGGWFGNNISRPSDEACDFATAGRAHTEAAERQPEGFDERLDLLVEGAQRFVDLARSVDLDEPVWALSGPGPRRFWLLRAATEAAVHRWDAEVAAGNPSAIDPRRAATSLDETYLGAYPRFQKTLRFGTLSDRPLGVVATDSGHSWKLEDDDGSIVSARSSDLPECVASGPGHDLVLFTWGRTDGDDLDIAGDPGVARSWRPFVAPDQRG